MCLSAGPLLLIWPSKLRHVSLIYRMAREAISCLVVLCAILSPTRGRCIPCFLPSSACMHIALGVRAVTLSVCLPQSSNVDIETDSCLSDTDAFMAAVDEEHAHNQNNKVPSSNTCPFWLHLMACA